MLKFKRGQTLLEGTIAMGIIATALSSALTLVTASISAERESGQAVIGANLAREGMEVVRNIRDSNWMAGRPWDEGLESVAGFDRTGVPVFSPADGTWAIDFTPNLVDDNNAAIFRYVTGSAAPVGLYVNNAAAIPTAPPADTAFSGYRRLLTIDAICEDNGSKVQTTQGSGANCPAGTTKVGLQVNVRSRWGQTGRTRTFDADEKMYNWR